eukprot:6654939-Prymnesium_polylepis.1
MAALASSTDNMNPAHVLAKNDHLALFDLELADRVLMLRDGMLGEAAKDDGSTPLHYLCSNGKLTAPMLERFIVGHPGAATTRNKAGSTPLHKLLETAKQRLHDVQAALVERYIALAPEATHVKNLKGQLPAESLFAEVRTRPQPPCRTPWPIVGSRPCVIYVVQMGLVAHDFAPFIQADLNPLRPCATIAFRLRKKARQQPRRRELLLQIAEELQDVASRVVRSMRQCGVTISLQANEKL